MCCFASFSKQLKVISEFSDIKAGNVLISGGFPGHAIVVLDVAINTTGKKIWRLQLLNIYLKKQSWKHDNGIGKKNAKYEY